MELTVGGDEIQLFLEGEINNQDKLAQEIQSTIMKAGAIGRVTCMQKSEEAD
jgi:hypothetical protein